MATPASRARRTPFSGMAGQLYPEDDRMNSVSASPDEDGGEEQDSDGAASPVQPMSQEEMAGKVYPDDKRDKIEAMPPDGGKTKSRNDQANPGGLNDAQSLATDEMRNWSYGQELREHFVTGKALDHVGQYVSGITKGARSVAEDVIAGSKDAAHFLANISGLNGKDAQEKTGDQLEAFIGDAAKDGKAIYNGLSKYYTDPKVTEAVNGAIRKVAPEVWGEMVKRGWEFLGNPEETGKFVGGEFATAGIGKAAAPAKYILKAFKFIGTLDAADKNLQSKIEQLLLDTDYTAPGKTPAPE